MATHRAPAYDADAHTPAEHDGLFRTSGGVWVPKSVGEKITDELLTANGDLLYRNGSGNAARLAKGGDGQVLTLASGLPAWADAGGGLWEHVETINEAAAATWDSATLEDDYLYRLVIHHWQRSSGSGVVYARVDTGSGVDTGGSDYAWHTHVTGTGHALNRDSADSEMQLSGTTTSSSSTHPSQWEMTFGQRAGERWWLHATGFTTFDLLQIMAWGVRLSASEVVSLRLYDSGAVNCEIKGELWRMGVA